MKTVGPVVLPRYVFTAIMHRWAGRGVVLKRMGGVKNLQGL